MLKRVNFCTVMNVEVPDGTSDDQVQAMDYDALTKLAVDIVAESHEVIRDQDEFLNGPVPTLRKGI